MPTATFTVARKRVIEIMTHCYVHEWHQTYIYNYSATCDERSVHAMAGAFTLLRLEEKEFT